MRQRQERVANGKFPCGLWQKLKAVRGGVGGCGGGWGGGGEGGEGEGETSAVGNFHYHPIEEPFQTPPPRDRQAIMGAMSSLIADILWISD